MYFESVGDRLDTGKALDYNVLESTGVKLSGACCLIFRWPFSIKKWSRINWFTWTYINLYFGLGGEVLMSNDKEIILTLEGLAKLEKELEHLKTVRRREVAERIRQALEFGDISENSEYDDAKNEQGFIEGKILSIEKMLRNAKVIDEQDGQKTDVVKLGSRVTLVEVNGGAEAEYSIVGSAEANPLENKISNESPVGKSIIGHKVGEVVNVVVPMGTIQYRIKAIK